MHTFRRSKRRNSGAPIVKKNAKKEEQMGATLQIFALGFWFFDVGPDRSLGYSLKFTATDRFLKIHRHGTSCSWSPRTHKCHAGYPFDPEGKRCETKS